MLYLAILHGDKIENSVDFMFFPLSHFTNFDKPIYDNLIIIDSESSASPLGPWFIAYNRAACKSLKIDIYEQVQKALYCKFGDNEEFIETLLTENGEYLIHYQLIK